MTTVVDDTNGDCSGDDGWLDWMSMVLMKSMVALMTVNTLRLRQNDRYFAWRHYQIHFLNENSFKFHKDLFPRVRLTICHNYHSFFHTPGGNQKISATPRWVNSSPPSAAYMCQWIGSSLVQIMACRLFGAKPLSKPMLDYCQLDS